MDGFQVVNLGDGRWVEVNEDGSAMLCELVLRAGRKVILWQELETVELLKDGTEEPGKGSRRWVAQ